MSLDDAIRGLADQLDDSAAQRIRVLNGVIDHVVPGGTANGAAAFVNIGGAIFQSVYLAPYTPTAGDLVRLLMVDGTPTILGPVAAGSVAISGNINVGANGALDLGAGGTVKVEDASGNPLATLGVDRTGNYSGLETVRPSGGSMLQSFGKGTGSLSYTQIVDIWGNGVVWDDPFTGGVGRPRVPLGQWVPASTPGTPEPQVSTSTWTTVALLDGYDQAARGIFRVRVTSSVAGTTGNVQIIDQTGVAIGASQPIAAATTADLVIGPLTLPNWTKGGPVTFQLQVQRTAGTGWVSARGRSAWGCAAIDTN